MKHYFGTFIPLSVMLVLALTFAGGALTAETGCAAHLSPKVTIDVADRTAYAALRLFDTDEEAAYHAKLITPAQHQAISAKLSQLYQGVIDVANIGINLPTGGTLSAADLVKINGLALSVTDLATLIAPSVGAALQADYAAFQTKVSALINAVKGLPS
jgi:hypothetical protein